MKRCPKCKTEKPDEDFHPRPERPNSRRPYCKVCAKVDAAERRHSPEGIVWRRNYDLRKYGITADDYDALLVKQLGRCAICRTNTPGGQGGFKVDHDHETGRVRGLLCHNCNIGIGNLKDDPWNLMRATAYLFTHKAAA